MTTRTRLKTVPKSLLILGVIVLVGVFLRTYRFHDWLRFNADQARDASLVSNVVEGKEALPLLGPKAGGTEFKLGGAFYYLQIMSAELFGNSPDRMAYPDLFASILTIPLLYLLMRRAFREHVALMLTAITGFSVFAIKYARFAWNPNSGPFYTLLLLFALLALADENIPKKWRYAALAGIALGIGVQLHTLLLVIMPVVVLGFFGYVAWKERTLWRHAAIVFLVALALNTGQVVDLAQTHGANIRAFFGGTQTKTAKGSTFLNNFLDDTTCQAQADAFMVSGLGDDDQCGVSVIADAISGTGGMPRQVLLYAGLIAASVFTLGGAWLWIAAIRRSVDARRKLLLKLTGWYALIGFLLLIPLAKEVSLRFYLALYFVPFVILGLWIELIFDRTRAMAPRYAVWVVAAIVVTLLLSNLSAVKTAFEDHVGKKQLPSSTDTEITLGETEFIADYIVAHAMTGGTVIVEGKQTYLFKYLKSIAYFTRKRDIAVEALSKKTHPNPDAPIVYIDNVKNGGKLTKSMSQTYTAEDIRSYGRFSAALLARK